VLQRKDSIENGLGDIVLPLVLTLFLSWIIIYISIVKGIKTSGKLSYVFAIVPYVFLITLLVIACGQKGAWEGIMYFIDPRNSERSILDPQVWYNACTQCFFSLTIGMGCIIMFSSYNKFDHNIYRFVFPLNYIYNSKLTYCPLSQ
jgi:solute carrier family 6 (neurotransmitter transporter, glycine) member 5/9